MGRVLYTTDGEGAWWRTEFAEQCGEHVFIMGKCQGVKGHEDQCWSYGPDGSYLFNCEDGGCGSTPPGNKSYVSPEDKYEGFYMQHRTEEEVTDLDSIQRLENDDLPEPGAWVNRPLAKDDPMYDDYLRRLEEYKRSHPDG